MFNRFRGAASGKLRLYTRLLAGTVIATNIGAGAGIWYYNPVKPAIAATVPSDSRVITLPDGRRVGVREYGAPNGRPLFALHGIGGSRIEIDALALDQRIKPKSPAGVAAAATAASATAVDSIAASAGVRVIALDRAGNGLSDGVDNRVLTDQSKDVLAVADALGIQQFSVLGLTTGGSYALACAHAIPRVAPNRLKSVALVSSSGPATKADRPAEALPLEPDARLKWSYLNAPFPATFMFKLSRIVAFKAPGVIAQHLTAQYSKSAEDLKAYAETDTSLSEWNIHESYRMGVAGVVRDMQLEYVVPYGFELNEIDAAVPVSIWHGTSDKIIPAAWAEYNAKRIPNNKLHLIAGAGHLTAASNSWKDIITEATLTVPPSKPATLIATSTPTPTATTAPPAAKK